MKLVDLLLFVLVLGTFVIGAFNAKQIDDVARKQKPVVTTVEKTVVITATPEPTASVSAKPAVKKTVPVSAVPSVGQ